MQRAIRNESIEQAAPFQKIDEERQLPERRQRRLGIPFDSNYPPPFLGRRYLGRQAKVSRMVWKGFAPLSLAVSTVVLTSASAFAAHMAR